MELPDSIDFEPGRFFCQKSAELFFPPGVFFITWKSSPEHFHRVVMGYPTQLKNGSMADSQQIKTYYDSWLKPLYNEDPELAALLYFYATDPTFTIEPERRRWFIRLSFLREDGSLDADFRNVILSAITIDPEASTLSIERPERSVRSSGSAETASAGGETALAG